MKVPVEKRGFLGIKKAFMETCTIEVNEKTYLQEAEKEWENRPYSIEEMIFYDDLFDGDYRPIREPLIMQITTYSGNYIIL